MSEANVVTLAGKKREGGNYSNKLWLLVTASYIGNYSRDMSEQSTEYVFSDLTQFFFSFFFSRKIIIEQTCSILLIRVLNIS